MGFPIVYCIFNYVGFHWWPLFLGQFVGATRCVRWQKVALSRALMRENADLPLGSDAEVEAKTTSGPKSQ